MDANWIIDFLQATFRAATPLIFCALGVLIAERAGVVFLGVEGVMLIGALVSILGTLFGGSAWIGILLTIAIGALLGYIISLLLVWLPTDQVVVGIAFNLAALGITSYVYRLAGTKAQTAIPQIGSVFLGLNMFEIIAIILTIVAWWFLFKTGTGLKMRSVGESAISANAAGIDVLKVRTIALIVASVLAALGGAALSMGWVSTFSDNVTQGRGFIALAAVYLGRWNPIFAALGAVLFGAGEALAYRSQALNGAINPYFYYMLPYVLTLIVIGIKRPKKGPADVGNTYIRR